MFPICEMCIEHVILKPMALVSFMAVKFMNIPIDISQSRGIFSAYSHALNHKVQILQTNIG